MLPLPWSRLWEACRAQSKAPSSRRTPPGGARTQGPGPEARCFNLRVQDRIQPPADETPGPWRVQRPVQSSCSRAAPGQERKPDDRREPKSRCRRRDAPGKQSRKESPRNSRRDCGQQRGDSNDLFGAVLRPEEIRLGGGTVLAARYGYGHRTSHDLDYWFTETAAERLAQAANEYVWEMMMGRAGELRTDRGAAEAGCGGKIRGVEFSLGPAGEREWTDGGQPIQGSGLKAQSTVMILAGKITKRWTTQRRGGISIRDLVDVAIAARIEPEALDTILRTSDAEERALVIENLKATPANQHEIDRKPITALRYKMKLEGLAQEMIPMIKTQRANAAPRAVPTQKRDRASATSNAE